MCCESYVKIFRDKDLEDHAVLWVCCRVAFGHRFACHLVQNITLKLSMQLLYMSMSWNGYLGQPKMKSSSHDASLCKDRMNDSGQSWNLFGEEINGSMVFRFYCWHSSCWFLFYFFIIHVCCDSILKNGIRFIIFGNEYYYYSCKSRFF